MAAFREVSWRQCPQLRLVRFYARSAMRGTCGNHWSRCRPWHWLCNQSATIRDVFLCGLRLHLFDDAVFLDAVRFKVVGHALRFHDRFIRLFATGDDANGVRIFRSDSRLRCQDDTAALCSDLICAPALQTPSHSRD